MAGATRSALYALYKDDYLYHDGVEDVTFTNGDGLEVINVKAKKELPATSEAQLGSDIADQSTNCKWVLWDSTLDGNEPEHDETLTTATGEVWRFTGAITRALWDTQWHIDCKKDR